MSRKIQVGIFWGLLLLMSCNGSTGKPELIETGGQLAYVKETDGNSDPEPVIDRPESGPPEGKVYKTCAAFITDLVKSSNAAALHHFKAVLARAADISPEKISIELYVINNVSEDPSTERMAERTVGWLEFFPATGKLQDITNDPEKPELLQYNTGMLQKDDADKLCLNTPGNSSR
ncbi:MAG: hypothetical protein EOP54_00950 [Sphingobacteriales bacterium]|nr:MAG: hypothetical protein EOP54_00950 [Sphingobacteriales bacterium]